jgi:hypothetical protein
MIVDSEFGNVGFGAVLTQRLHLQSRQRVRNPARDVVGTLWSHVASTDCGRQRRRPDKRIPSKACGLVTS